MISGKTRLYALLGHPVAQARSPHVMNGLFEGTGIDATMIPFDVSPQDLAAFVTCLRSLQNLDGLAVTVPHKVAMAPLCDQLTARADAAGAVNAIRREPDGTLIGDLLDGAGFVAGLRSADHQISSRRVWVVGAGGAASAIAFAVAAEGPAQLTLVNRSAQKLEALISRLIALYPQLNVQIGGDIGDQDIVVNATSLGLKPDDPLPVDVERASPGTLVVEVIMQPEYTPLLNAARSRNLQVLTGKAMLEGQISELFAFLTEGQNSFGNAE